ncbi:DUF11 domain-containing protein, partial [Larkinella rosea]
MKRTSTLRTGITQRATIHGNNCRENDLSAFQSALPLFTPVSPIQDGSRHLTPLHTMNTIYVPKNAGNRHSCVQKDNLSTFVFVKNCLQKQLKIKLPNFITGAIGRRLWQTTILLLCSVGMVVAQNPNLYVRKKINNSKPVLNEIVSYTVVVGNDGNAAATGVVVKDELSVGAQYSMHTVLKGANAFTPATGTWNIGSLAAGDSVVLELKAKVIERGVWFNTAEVIASQGTDPNSTPNNHDISEDDMASVCFSVPIEWYEGDEFTVTIPIPLTDVQWTRNDQSGFPANLAVASGNTLVIKSPGIYSFTGMLGSCPVGGCCAIEVIPGPSCQISATAITNPTCEASPLVLSVTAQGGTAPYQYAWTGPNGFNKTGQNQLIPVATVVNAGVYTVKITDANNCTALASATAIVGTLPVAICNSPVCEGGTITLSATDSGTTYRWYGPNGFTSSLQSPTIPNATTANSGSYTVVITGAAICSGTAITSLTILPKPTIVASVSNSVCVGGTFSLSATASGATGPYQYIWTGPNGFYETGQMVVVNNAMLTHTGSYTVTVFSQSGCINQYVTTPVTVKACICNPVAGASPPTVCVGATVSLTATNGFNTYSWKGPNNFTSALQNPVITNAQLTHNGNYTLTVTGPTCSGTAVVNVTVQGIPIAVASSTTVCTGGIASIFLNSSGGGSYGWKGPNGYSSTLQNPVISNASASNNGSYTVVVTNASGCSAAQTTSVNVGVCTPGCTLNASVVSSVSAVCAGGSVTLTATPSGNTGAVSYQWSGPGLSASNTASVTAGSLSTTSTFTVVVSEGGCSVTKTISVVVNPLPVVSNVSASTLCSSGVASIQLTSSGGGSYGWKGPNGYSSTLQNPVISNASASNNGSYTVVVTNASGCSAVQVVAVNVGTCGVGCTLNASVVSSVSA